MAPATRVSVWKRARQEAGRLGHEMTGGNVGSKEAWVRAKQEEGRRYQEYQRHREVRDQLALFLGNALPDHRHLLSGGDQTKLQEDFARAKEQYDRANAMQAQRAQSKAKDVDGARRGAIEVSGGGAGEITDAEPEEGPTPDQIEAVGKMQEYARAREERIGLRNGSIKPPPDMKAAVDQMRKIAQIDWQRSRLPNTQAHWHERAKAAEDAKAKYDKAWRDLRDISQDYHDRLAILTKVEPGIMQSLRSCSPSLAPRKFIEFEDNFGTHPHSNFGPAPSPLGPGAHEKVPEGFQKAFDARSDLISNMDPDNFQRALGLTSELPKREAKAEQVQAAATERSPERTGRSAPRISEKGSVSAPPKSGRDQDAAEPSRSPEPKPVVPAKALGLDID
ncbi:hypothetical protein CKO28_13305 [Rhodovibrio sodomensis]|uniref:MobA/MobL protein domain-containing protein n=2 Tax=Rhodovibrio sodomensis TaxID=1088 RepID=A0ABS1DEW4_9PROT|nr:hypothetical protein [Rhodovibrio sodomensis]